jgi:hypothetical protein
VDAVSVLAVVEHALGRGAARQDAEVGHPPFQGGVVACSRGVVFEEGWRNGG